VIGAAVGLEVGGCEAIGAMVGCEAIGAMVGCEAIGAMVGCEAIGAKVGLKVGGDVIGAMVGGDVIGANVGALVGARVGDCDFSNTNDPFVITPIVTSAITIITKIVIANPTNNFHFHEYPTLLIGSIYIYSNIFI
jgi:phage tail tape-measure protein